MKQEQDYSYTITSELSDLNEHHILKPYACQKMFAKIVERHLNEQEIGLSLFETTKNNLAWVLISLAFEIEKPVTGCINMTAHTWYSQRRGPYFRREFVFSDEKGIVLFKGSTFSILMDLEKRTVYRKAALPFFLFEPFEQFTVKARPSLKTVGVYKKVDERRVYNSYIDCIGHVNNSRYGEFAYDTLTEHEKNDLIHLKRMDICFLSELKNEQSFSILKAHDDERIMIRGHDNDKDRTAFEAVFSFEHKSTRGTDNDKR